MPLPSSGSISLNQMHVEVGGTSGTTCSLNDSDIRGLISKASGATSSFSQFYGASAVTALASGTGTTGVYARGYYNPGFWGYQNGTSTGSLSLTNGSFAAAFGTGCTNVNIYNEIPPQISGSTVISYKINPLGIGVPTVSWTSIKVIVGGSTYTYNRTQFATQYYGQVNSFSYYIYITVPFHNLASGTSFTWEIS